VRRALPWLLPGGAVLLACVSLLAWGPDGLPAVLTTRYRWIVYGSTLALAWGFHRSRVAIAVIALAALDLAAGAPGSALFPAGSSVLLVVLGLLALLRDRGVTSLQALLQLAAVGVVAAVPALILSAPSNLAAFLGFSPLPAALFGWSGIPQTAWLLAIPALAAGGYAAVRWEGAVERGLLWSQLTLLVAISAAAGPDSARLFLMAAGITLGLSVLETSYAMAYRDDLTGLPARRALMRDLEALGGTFTLAMVDVDHFKKFNDKHGHDVGDQVLKLVATRLAQAPGGGKAYRYGGEEFTLLFPGRLRADAAPHLEAVRGAVERASFSLRSWKRPKKKPSQSKKSRVGGRSLSVTVSIGMADTTGKDPTPAAVLKKADQALYRAKKKGRNQLSK
jgi:diguanylate cyclase (GGDEF)-like protein